MMFSAIFHCITDPKSAIVATSGGVKLLCIAIAVFSTYYYTQLTIKNVTFYFWL